MVGWKLTVQALLGKGAVLDAKAEVPNHLEFCGSHPGGGGGGEGARGSVSLSYLSRVGFTRAPAADVFAMFDPRFIMLGGVNTGYTAVLGVHME